MSVNKVCFFFLSLRIYPLNRFLIKFASVVTQNQIIVLCRRKISYIRQAINGFTTSPYLKDISENDHIPCYITTAAQIFTENIITLGKENHFNVYNTIYISCNTDKTWRCCYVCIIYFDKTTNYVHKVGLGVSNWKHHHRIMATS